MCKDLSEKLDAADTCIQITFKISVIDNILLKGLPFWDSFINCRDVLKVHI